MYRMSILFAIFLPAFSSAADSGTWRCHASGNHINNIDIAGDHLWCATEGSLVNWNVRDSTYTQYTTLDGLLDPETNHVSADPSGGAWVTYNRMNAASRFDGSSWTHFDKDRGGLPAQPVRALHVDAKGRAWLGYETDGIYHFDGTSWTRFLPDTTIDAAKNTIVVDESGNKWAGTGAGALAFNDMGYRLYTTKDGLAGNIVRRIGISPSGAVWFCTSMGVSCLDGGVWTTWRKDDGLVSNSVYALAFAPDGAVWFATDRGVSRFNGISWTSYTDTDGLIANKSTAIAADGAGRIWVCHPEEILGVSRFENGKWVWSSTWNSGIAGNRVYNVCSAPDGAAWFATDTGISRFDGASWASWTTHDGLVSARIGAVTVDIRGRVWIMYHQEVQKGVSVLENGAITTYTTQDGLLSNTVTAAAPEGDSVWFCTEKGLCRFNGSSWTNYPGNDRLISSTIYDIAEAPNGALWFATNKGLSRYDGVGWKTYTVEDGLPVNVVKTVTAGLDGRIWVVSDSTLMEFDGRAFIPHPVETNEKTKFVRRQIASIVVDANNRVITNIISLGGVSSGEPSTAFFRYNGNEWETIPTISQMLRQGNHSVAAGEGDTVWAAVSDGLLRLTLTAQSLWRTNTPDNNKSLIRVDSKNNKWFNNSPSFLMFDDRAWKTIKSDNYYGVLNFIIDSRDRKWLWNMLPPRSIVCLDGDTFFENTSPDGIDLSQYSSTSDLHVYLDQHDVKWFLTNGNNVIRYDNSSWTLLTVPSTQMVYSVMVDTDRVTWFGCLNCISSFDGVKWTTYTDADKLPLKSVRNIFSDSKGMKWAVASDKLVWFDGEEWQQVSNEKGFRETFVQSAMAGRDGVVFIAGSSSISRWDGSSWKQFPIPGTVSGLGYEKYVDRNNRFWFSASVNKEKLLVSCDGDSVRYHHPGTLYSAVEDRNGVLWFVVALTGGVEIMSFDERAASPPDERPKKVSLIGNYPNPFNAGTSIVFDIYSWGRAIVDIHSITGQKVRTLHSGIMDAGRHEIVWDGADGRGAKVSSGVYFARIRKDGAAETQKMMFVK